MIFLADSNWHFISCEISYPVSQTWQMPVWKITCSTHTHPFISTAFLSQQQSRVETDDLAHDTGNIYYPAHYRKSCQLWLHI